MRINKNRKAQEEMVGFIIIVVLVSVILLVVLGFMLKSSSTETVKDYEVESFIGAMLQYTSSCEADLEFLSVQDLIVECNSGSSCLDGENSCDVLNSTLKSLIKSGWNVNNQSAVKGYSFEVAAGDMGIFLLEAGNKTNDYKGSYQDFPKRSTNYIVSLDVYY